MAGLLVGVWTLLPPYTGPELNTAMRVEVADHVVPGIVLLAVSAGALVLARRESARPGTAMLILGLVVLLAGFWMTATHVPLVAQASRGQVPWGSAAYHTAPGLAVVALGLLWAARHWAEADSN